MNPSHSTFSSEKCRIH